MSSQLTTRYKLIIRNEESLEEKKQIPYTYSALIFIATLFFGLIFVLGFFTSQRFFSESTLSNDNGAEFVRKVKILNKKIDSLSGQFQGRDLFINNFRNVLGGEVAYFNNKDSGKVQAPAIRKVSDSINPDYIDPTDKRLREEFEGKQATTTYLTSNEGKQNLKSLYLFAPLKGVIAKKYSPSQKNYGVDIVSKQKSPITTIADGTIITTSWTSDKGYVVTIQHQSNLISVYMHCTALFKKSSVGSFVKAGEAIALLDKRPGANTKPRLHFELWYKGNPVNPEEFVSF